MITVLWCGVAWRAVELALSDLMWEAREEGGEGEGGVQLSNPRQPFFSPCLAFPQLFCKLAVLIIKKKLESKEVSDCATCQATLTVRAF